MFVTIPITMFLLGQTATTGSPQLSGDPIVQVGVFSYAPDGTIRAAAYDTDLSKETSVYVAGCAIGGGNRPAPDTATDAWRLSGKVQSLDASEAVVQLDWQRIRANGVAASSPSGSIQLTLHPGDRVPLDSASPEGTSQCMAQTIVFEARYDTRLGWARGKGGSGFRVGATGGGSSVGGAAAGPATGAGAGGGRSTGMGAGTGSGMGLGGGGGARIGSEPGSRQLDVDLWLVRNAPGRKEEAVHQALHGVRGGAAFAFAPVSIDTPRGPASVQIAGSFHVKLDESGTQQLVVATMRDVRFAAAGSPGQNTPQSIQGSSITTHPMPGPDDVLSLEMPPLRSRQGDATAAPDQFSLRIRIR